MPSLTFSGRLTMRMIHLLTAALIAIPVSAQADTQLSRDEVTALFAGKTVHYTVVPRKLKVVAYFTADGEARELRDGKPDNHPWWVKDNGAHCIQFKGKKPGCRKVFRRDDGTHVKYRKGKVLVEYHSFVEGNTENL